MARLGILSHQCTPGGQRTQKRSPSSDPLAVAIRAQKEARAADRKRNTAAKKKVGRPSAAETKRKQLQALKAAPDVANGNAERTRKHRKKLSEPYRNHVNAYNADCWLRRCHGAPSARELTTFFKRIGVSTKYTTKKMPVKGDPVAVVPFANRERVGISYGNVVDNFFVNKTPHEHWVVVRKSGKRSSTERAMWVLPVAQVRPSM